MNRFDYIMPVSLVKIQEKKLLSEQKLLRILETGSSKEILKTLSETDYSNSMLGINNVLDYEEILINEIKRVFKFARELAKKEQGIVDLIALKYEYQNIKLLLKNKLSSSNNDLTKYLLETGILDKKLLNENMKIAEKEKDALNLAITVDKMYLKHLSEMAKRLEYDIFIKYSKIIVDSYNILSFLRLKRMNKNIDYVENVFSEYGSFTKEELIKLFTQEAYIKEFKKYYSSKIWDDFEKNKDISEIEKMFENMIIDLAIEYKNVNIGPEPIFTYIIAKEYEIKALRLIISSKINSIDIDTVKNRLRGLYV